MKIVGIGLNKTGTTTLGACMRHWKLKHLGFSLEAFDLWRKKDYSTLMATVAMYDCFQDWPWPLVYKEIDAAFPGSKFILTRRESPEVWFESICKHAKRTGPTSFREAIFGFDMPYDHKSEHIRYYENHLESVRDYFKDRPSDLLEVCWEEGSEWTELAQFLGLPRPDIPFPHMNKSPVRRKKGGG